ncbi:hypothetical protein Clacol_001473 [Clathrus columnatus]|uniref:Uncharacterized protein n=1 Tax=Clathrus columnatus TaxID=1419009 RepID=A0AAV5A3P5_9AGAM|nr:hypothetical protein Clacol_001473 [Clathrus columnatus]
MIVPGQKNQGDPSSNLTLLTQEAPPAYEDLIRSQDVANFALTRTFDEKRRSTGSSTSLSEHEGQSIDARRVSSSGASAQLNPAKTARSLIGINKNSWFSWFSEKDTRKEVKQTIQSLIKDVVKDPTSPTAVCILQSCLEACLSKNLSFQNIISEKFIEGHCPIYWSIAKRTSSVAKTSEPNTAVTDVEIPDQQPDTEEVDDRIELLDILLSMPLNPTTRLEAYSACLLTSDNVLFQRLKKIPDEHANINTLGSSSISADELLLGEAPGDKIQVFDGNPDYGEFRVVWDIAHFHKRMRAIGSVNTQVVARHIWHLSFHILKKNVYYNTSTIKAGTWTISVSLLEPSSSSHLYAQLRIPEAESLEQKQKSQRKSSTSESEQTPGGWKSWNTKFGRKHMWNHVSKSNAGTNFSEIEPTGLKPPITLSLRTDSGTSDDHLEPVPLSALHTNPYPLQERRKSLLVALDKHQNGYSLQFELVGFNTHLYTLSEADLRTYY